MRQSYTFWYFHGETRSSNFISDNDDELDIVDIGAGVDHHVGAGVEHNVGAATVDDDELIDVRDVDDEPIDVGDDEEMEDIVNKCIQMSVSILKPFTGCWTI